MRETVLDLGATSWFKIGCEKIWVHLFWKIFTDGKYIVEFKNGKQHGQGTETYPRRSKYVGEWKDGVRNGQGTYTQYGSLLYPDGRKYVGEYKNGKEWNGTYYDNNGKKEYKLVNGEIE